MFMLVTYRDVAYYPHMPRSFWLYVDYICICHWVCLRKCYMVSVGAVGRDGQASQFTETKSSVILNEMNSIPQTENVTSVMFGKTQSINDCA